MSCANSVLNVNSLLVLVGNSLVNAHGKVLILIVIFPNLEDISPLVWTGYRLLPAPTSSEESLVAF